jgi:putative copper resistance protein D
VILVAARGLYFAATMLLFGEAAFAAARAKRLPVIAPAPATQLRWALLSLALLASGAWLVLAAAQMADTAPDAATTALALRGTLFGQVFAARIVLLLALAVLLACGARARWIALASGLALALPAITSHAAASSPANFTAIGAVLDAAHLLAGGVWIGGLAGLILLFRRRETNIVLALSLFSEMAMIAVLLLVMTGLVDAASILLGDKGAAAPLYLAVLGCKLAAVAAMLGLAVANRFRLLPRGDTAAIARNAAIELGLGLIAVLLAGALGQLPPTLPGM